MSGYTKLFNSLLASTIWREDDKTRIVWITMLAMADRNGIVEASIPGLADFARVSIDDCRHSLEKLQSPDPDSRTPESEGRRIEQVIGGWRLVNHRKYREKMGADERREYLKLKQRERRAKLKASTDVSTDRATNQQCDHIAEAEAEAAPSPNDLDPLKIYVPTNIQNPPEVGPLPLKATPPTARSKRPIHSGQRLTVFEWMFDDLVRMLGPHANEFDLGAWFWDLDARCVKNGDVPPDRDGGAWLRAVTLEEAQRRGLPLKVAEPPKTKRTNKRIAGLIAGGEAFLRISQES